MKFKKLKYNIISIFLVLLVASAVLLKVYFIDGQIPDSSIDNIIPETPDDTPNNGENDDPSIELPIDDTRDPNIPSANYPTNVLNYCLNKLSTSDGYKSKVSLITKITGGYGAVSVNALHITDGTTIMSGKQMIEQMQYVPKDELAEKFSTTNGLITSYYDGQYSHIWRTPNGVFDMSKAEYRKVDGIINVGAERFYFNRLFPSNIKFDKKGVSSKLSTQKNSKTGREEYIITAKLLNIAYYPEQFSRSYYTFQNHFKYTSVNSTIVFTIDKKTGWLKNYVQHDVFSGYYPAIEGSHVSIDLTYTQTFSNHNQSLSISHPTIPPEPPKE